MSITCDVCGEDDAPAPGVCIDCILRGEEALKVELRRVRREKAELERALDMLRILPERRTDLSPTWDEDDVEVMVVVRWRKHRWMEATSVYAAAQPQRAKSAAIEVVNILRDRVQGMMERDLNPSNGGDGS